MKRCSKCETTKPLDDFPPRKSSRDGRHGWCRPCYRAYYSAAQRRWRANNPERDRASQRRYIEKHADELPERWARYRAKNREALNEKARNRDPKRKREIYAKWRKKNREQELIRLATRRALCKDTPELREFIEYLRSQPCAYCGSEEDISIDHIIPLARGGKHDAENLAPACLPCNCSKNSRLLSEWPGPTEYPLRASRA